MKRLVLLALIFVADAVAEGKQDCAAAARLTSEGLTGSIEEGLKKFKQAAELCPTMDEARYNEAVYLARSGNRNEALQILAALPDSKDEVLLLRARLLSEIDRGDDAVPLLENFLSEKPEQPDAVLLLAGIKAKTGDVREALRLLVAVPNPSPYVRINIALLYEKLVQIDEATTAMDQLAAEANLDENLAIAAAEFFLRQHQLQKANNVLTRLKNPRAQILLARIYLEQERFDQADVLVHQLPDSEEKLQLTALLMMRRHQEEQALVALQNLEKKKGLLAPRWLALRAMAFLALGQTDRARELASKIIVEDASDALAHYVLGEALIRLGSKTAGRESLERAAAIDERFRSQNHSWWRSLLD